jgi:hypothetical protein
LKEKIKYFVLFFILINTAFLISCGDDDKETLKDEHYGEVAYSPDRDSEIQRYNLEVRKQQAVNRTPCDTIALIEFVLGNYPEGTYLVDYDKTLTYNIPQPAVLYHRHGGNYVFGVIARSRPGERLIETKNIVGYDQSFIDLDSTKLGTAFFYLTLFECVDEKFRIIWEAPIPSHGGFNDVSIHEWNYNGTTYIRVNFHYGQGVGHINYNYFLVDGLTSFPHLLMTYKGINFQRTVANVNNDNYPDYYEHIYYDTGSRIYSSDSVAFTWNHKDSVYVNTRNKRQTRPY